MKKKQLEIAPDREMPAALFSVESANPVKLLPFEQQFVMLAEVLEEIPPIKFG